MTSALPLPTNLPTKKGPPTGKVKLLPPAIPVARRMPSLGIVALSRGRILLIDRSEYVPGSAANRIKRAASPLSVLPRTEMVLNSLTSTGPNSKCSPGTDARPSTNVIITLSSVLWDHGHGNWILGCVDDQHIACPWLSIYYRWTSERDENENVVIPPIANKVFLRFFNSFPPMWAFMHLLDAPSLWPCRLARARWVPS